MDIGVAQRRVFSRRYSLRCSSGRGLLPTAARSRSRLRGSQPSSKHRQAGTATDPYTVLFTLTSSYASFLRVLAVTPIVSPLAEKQGKLSREAVGTGPYKFLEWKTGEYVLEERNEQYWGPRPTIKQLKWIWTSEPVLINMSVLAGAADIVNPLPPIFAEALSRNRKVKLIQGGEARSFGWHSTPRESPWTISGYARR